MKSILVICLIALTSVSAIVPVPKEYGGKYVKDSSTTVIVTDKYLMNYTYVQELEMEMNMVYDNENIVGETTTTYKPKNVNKALSCIKNNQLIEGLLAVLGCKTKGIKVISYKWLEKNCPDGVDTFDDKLPEALVLGKQQESDSVAYKIISGTLTDIQYKLGKNIDLNNEVEHTLEPDSSSALIPGLMVLIITLGLLLF